MIFFSGVSVVWTDLFARLRRSCRRIGTRPVGETIGQKMLLCHTTTPKYHVRDVNQSVPKQRGDKNRCLYNKWIEKTRIQNSRFCSHTYFMTRVVNFSDWLRRRMEEYRISVFGIRSSTQTKILVFSGRRVFVGLDNKLLMKKKLVSVREPDSVCVSPKEWGMGSGAGVVFPTVVSSSPVWTFSLRFY